MMKIGVCVIYRSMDKLDEQFRSLVERNFDNCQLVWWDTTAWNDGNAAVVNELVKKYGITISAFWCGWEGPTAWNFYEGQKTLGLVPAEYREARVKNLCDGSDFAKKLGVENIVTHMGFIPENPYDPEFEPLCDAIRTVAEHMKKNGQYLLFETGQETPVTMLRCFEKVGTDNLAVNLDTANLIMYGKANPVDAVDIFGKYIRNLHAKDGTWPVNGHDLGKAVRVGEGSVDFDTVLHKLHALGYDGYVTIEREIEGEQQIRDVNDARACLQEILDRIYG